MTADVVSSRCVGHPHGEVCGRVDVRYRRLGVVRRAGHLV